MFLEERTVSSKTKWEEKRGIKKDNLLPSYTMWKHLCNPRCFKDFKEFLSFHSDNMQKKKNESFNSPLSIILLLCEPTSGLKGRPQVKKEKVQGGNLNLQWWTEHLSLFKTMFLPLPAGLVHLVLRAHLAGQGGCRSWWRERTITAAWSPGCGGDQRVTGTEAGPLQKRVILRQENPLPGRLEPNGGLLGSGNHQLGFNLKCVIIRCTQSQTPHGNLVVRHMFGTLLVFANAPGLWSRRSTRENAGPQNRERKELGREPLCLWICDQSWELFNSELLCWTQEN